MLIMTLKVIDIIENMSETFKEDAYIEEVYLFGSQARGTSGKKSDIDLAIVTGPLEKVNKEALRKKADEFDIKCHFTYTTKYRLQKSNSVFDVNTHIRNDGILVWKRDKD